MDTPPQLMFIVGSPGKGKSVYIKNLIYDLTTQGKLHYGIVMCPTIFNGAYDYIPEDYRYASYDEDVIRKLMKGQKKLRESDIEKQAFIIFDDCIGTAEWNSKLMKELCTTYRHLRITVIIATQYSYSIPPLIRSCTSVAIIFKPPNEPQVKALLQCFFHDYSDVADLKQEFDKLQKYEFIRVWCNKSIEEGRYEIDKAEMKNFNLNF